MSPQLSRLVVSAMIENIPRYCTTWFGADGSGCWLQSCGSGAVIPSDVWAYLHALPQLPSPAQLRTLELVIADCRVEISEVLQTTGKKPKTWHRNLILLQKTLGAGKNQAQSL